MISRYLSSTLTFCPTTPKATTRFHFCCGQLWTSLWFTQIVHGCPFISSMIIYAFSIFFFLRQLSVLMLVTLQFHSCLEEEAQGCPLRYNITYFLAVARNWIDSSNKLSFVPQLTQVSLLGYLRTQEMDASVSC